MKYEIFSDAAFRIKQGIAGLGYFIKVTDACVPRFVGQQSFVVHDCQNINIAEAISLGVALRNFKEQVTATNMDIVVIRVDSMHVSEFFKEILAGTISVDSNKAPTWVKLNKRIIREIISELDAIKEQGASVKILRLDSHQGTMNGNSVADRLANTALNHS